MTHDRTHFRRIPALLLLFALLLPAAVPALAAGPEGPGALSQAGADFLKALSLIHISEPTRPY